MPDGVRARGWRGGEVRPCGLRRTPSRRDFDVSTFHRTWSIIGERFEPIIDVLKFDSMCNFIARFQHVAGRSVLQPAPGAVSPRFRRFGILLNGLQRR